MTSKINRAKDSGHIKSHTKGTSNEISFSVLDSMKGEGSEDVEEQPLGRISLFTLGKNSKGKGKNSISGSPVLPIGSKGGTSSKKAKGKAKTASHAPKAAGSLNFPRPAWEIDHAETGMRRKRRIKANRLIKLAVVAVVVVLAAIGLSIGVNAYQSRQALVNDLNTQIESVSGLYEQTQDFRNLVDKAISTPLAELDPQELQAEYDASLKGIEGVLTKLRAAKTALEDLHENLNNPMDNQALSETLESVTSQLNLIEIGRVLLDDAISTATQYRSAEDFMSKLLQADSLARESALYIIDFDDERAAKSKELSIQAREAFTVARDQMQGIIGQTAALFEEATELDPDNYTQDPLQIFVDYANLRIEAQSSAILADEAYIRRNSSDIVSANNAYNRYESEAAELYSTTIAYPQDLIVSAYDRVKESDEYIKLWNAEAARAS